MLTDDLPWPELGNVSRGATRGNQGQKGVLGPPDNEGRSLLQLRVQPGVLAVRLNRQATEWYRTLDLEVNKALKLTKTYWRKARRRQDYDARADQDHMELHEWLQQLKDKCMSHLELLMQKGDIQGPPYIMPEEIDLPFLKKFIQRQAMGIPHNPRLRAAGHENYLPHIDDGLDDGPETPDHLRDSSHLLRQGLPDESLYSPRIDRRLSIHDAPASYGVQNREGILQSCHISMQKLQDARANLAATQRDTQDAFRKYNASLEGERHARMEVAAAEKRRDDAMFLLLSHLQSSRVSSRQSSTSLEEHHTPNGGYEPQVNVDQKPLDVPPNTNPPWNGTPMYTPLPPPSEFHLPDQNQPPFQDHHLLGRKHPRDWDSPNDHHLQGRFTPFLPIQVKTHQRAGSAEDVFSPRKRHMSEYDGVNGLQLPAQELSLPS